MSNFQKMNRRDFIKTATMGFFAAGALGFLPYEKVFAADSLSVKTRYGTFNGFQGKNGVSTWLGIPYAKPPVKKLRWRAPEALKPSDKTFEAKKFGYAAMQVNDAQELASKNPQSEDCLTLNIWTRGGKKNKPVMVFVHGGGFQSGGSSDPSYDGANIAAAYDVVVVSFNYRINVLGFVNFSSIDPSYEDSGYLGIKDQVAALKWVKENIAEFGGNPDNITIFGESAGAISNMMLAVLPAAKGLFQKTIPQSANSYMYNTPESSAQVAETYLKLSGEKNMSGLMKKTSAELVELYVKVKNARAAETVRDYLPTCDGKYLPANPFKALKKGGAKGIKFLTGTTADEWRYWLLYMDNFFEVLHKDYSKLSPVMQKYTAKSANAAQVSEEIYKTWLNGRPHTEELFATFANQLDWRVGQELASEYQSSFGDVYYYLFNEQSADERLRSCHAIDLPYTFNTPCALVPNPSPQLIRQIQASWTAFAATGSPDNEFIPHWKKYTAANRWTMELNSKGCMCHNDLNTKALQDLRYIYET